MVLVFSTLVILAVAASLPATAVDGGRLLRAMPESAVSSSSSSSSSSPSTSPAFAKLARRLDNVAALAADVIGAPAVADATTAGSGHGGAATTTTGGAKPS